jgi:hypothetical protein
MWGMPERWSTEAQDRCVDKARAAITQCGTDEAYGGVWCIRHASATGANERR